MFFWLNSGKLKKFLFSSFGVKNKGKTTILFWWKHLENFFDVECEKHKNFQKQKKRKHCFEWNINYHMIFRWVRNDKNQNFLNFAIVRIHQQNFFVNIKKEILILKQVILVVQKKDDCYNQDKIYWFIQQRKISKKRDKSRWIKIITFRNF